MNKTINQLIEYGLKNHMISKEDESYAVNLLLDLLKIDQFEKEETEEVSIYQILDKMLDYAVVHVTNSMRSSILKLAITYYHPV